jgi:hypothetical protein
MPRHRARRSYFAETNPMASTPSIGPFDRDQARERLSAVTTVPYAAVVPTRPPMRLIDRLREALNGQIGRNHRPAVPRHSLAGAQHIAQRACGSALRRWLDRLCRRLANLPNAIDPPRSTASALEVTLRAPGFGQRTPGLVRAYDLKGGLIAEQDIAFRNRAATATADIALPVDLRNDIARLELVGEGHAASVYLLDDRWRRRSVGLVSGETRERAQPLLAPLYYLRRAAEPFATLMEPRAGTLEENVTELVENRASVIALADIGALRGSAATLERWVGNGGILVRFAGPRLAASADDLIPVELRRGERSLGGTLSWSEPQRLRPFAESQPVFRDSGLRRGHGLAPGSGRAIR